MTNYVVVVQARDTIAPVWMFAVVLVFVVFFSALRAGPHHQVGVFTESTSLANLTLHTEAHFWP